MARCPPMHVRWEGRTPSTQECNPSPTPTSHRETTSSSARCRTATRGRITCSRGWPRRFTSAAKRAPRQVPASATLDAFEFGYRFDKPIAAGDQVIHLTNSGRQPHEAQLARLPAGVIVDQYLALNDGTSTTKGSSYGGSFDIQLGSAADFNVYFTSGSYAFICFETDPQTGKAHFELGQILQFSVP